MFKPIVGIGRRHVTVFTINLLILWYIVMRNDKEAWMQLDGTNTALLDARIISLLGREG